MTCLSRVMRSNALKIEDKFPKIPEKHFPKGFYSPKSDSILSLLIDIFVMVINTFVIFQSKKCP